MDEIKYRVKQGFSYQALEELGYTYSPIEGGYLSKDLATIVINNRRPYVGRVVKYMNMDEELHLKNINELQDKGYLESYLNT